jgi:hypothetical protein
VFLQIVTLTGYVGSNFHTIAQSNARDLAKRRIWLLGSNRSNLEADTALLRATLSKFNLLAGK